MGVGKRGIFNGENYQEVKVFRFVCILLGQWSNFISRLVEGKHYVYTRYDFRKLSVSERWDYSEISLWGLESSFS